MRIKRFCLILLSLLVSGVFTMAPLYAQERSSSYLPQFRLHIDQADRRLLLNQDEFRRSKFLYPELSNVEPYADLLYHNNYLQQYDAQLYYPINTLQGMSLDLGLNIKYLNGMTRNSREGGLVSSHNFSDAIPMFYATALFELPFEGLSAGFEGSMDYASTRAFDYKAKLKYNWNRGFGLEGGWQHQQYSLDYGQQQPALDYESKGLFLDLFMNF